MWRLGVTEPQRSQGLEQDPSESLLVETKMEA